MIEALRLQLEWGADEALLDTGQDRQAAKPVAAPAATPARRLAAASAVPALPIMPAGPAQPIMPAGPADAARIAAACDTLEALQQALTTFTGCALTTTATQLVFADGAADAKIMIIGEAPGGEEDRVGRPFVGPAGQLLDKMLASIGLDRTQVRIANIVPWRPPGNRNPTESEIAVCLPFLHRQIALVRPDCLLLLGAVAAKALLSAGERNAGIRRLRGNWRQVTIPGLAAALPSLPSYHPAYLLRTAAAKREAWLDLLTLRDWRSNH